MPAIVPAPTETNPRKLAAAIKRLAEGGSNSIGTFTLTAGVTSTTVPAPTCATGSYVLPTALTQHAAAALATTSIVAGQGQFVVTHANSAQTDRIFGYLVVG